MTLNARLVSEIIRQKAGWKDDSQAARVTNAIPEALKQFGRLYAADQYTRQLLTTDKSTAILPITAGGKVSLTSGYNTYFFLEEYIDIGEMYFLPSATLTAVSAVSDTITIATYLNAFADFDRVRFTVSGGGTLPTGISLLTDYYIINYDATTGIMQLSTTSDGGGLVNIGSGYAATVSMVKQDPDDNPIQLKSPQLAALPNYLDGEFTYGYIQGNVLFLLPVTNTGNVAFAVPYYPNNLAALPASAEAEKLFLQTLMNMVSVPVQPNGI